MTMTLVNTLAPEAITAGVSPRTTTFNAGTMTNGVLLLAMTTMDVDDQITGVTWGGAAMTLLGQAAVGSPDPCFLWGLVSPANGTQTISMTYTGDGNYGGQIWGASFSCSATPSFGTGVTNAATGTSVSTGSVTCPSGGNVVGVMHHAFAGSDPTFTSAGTSIILNRLSNKSKGFAIHTSTVNFAWTCGSSQPWAAVGVPINVGGGGGGFKAAWARPRSRIIQ